MDDLVGKIRTALPPEAYGLKQACMGQVQIDPNHGTYVHRDRQNLEKGWECGDSALKIKEILEEEGRKVEICRGISSDEIAHVHLFARDEQGTIYDGTPLYRPIGEPHTVEQVLTEADIDANLRDSRLFLDNSLIPIHWSQEGDAHYLVACSTGLTHFPELSLDPEFNQTVLFVAKRERKKITCVESIAVCDNEAYKKNGFSPLQTHTLERAEERVKKLNQREIAMFYGATIYPAFDQSIPADIARKIRENLDAMCALIDNQEAARNVVQ